MTVPARYTLTGAHFRITDLEDALRNAITTIEGLAEQQAMADDWWEAKVAEYKSVLTAAERPSDDSSSVRRHPEKRGDYHAESWGG